MDIPPPISSLTWANRLLGWLPAGARRWALLKMSKPGERPRDVYDLLKEDPYTIEEVEKDTVWKVMQKHEDWLE